MEDSIVSKHYVDKINQVFILTKLILMVNLKFGNKKKNV